MQYFDGMGNDRTLYVQGLERRIKECEALMEVHKSKVNSDELINPDLVKPHKKKVK